MSEIGKLQQRYTNTYENKRKEIKNNDNKQKVMIICLLLLPFSCFLLF